MNRYVYFVPLMMLTAGIAVVPTASAEESKCVGFRIPRFVVPAIPTHDSDYIAVDTDCKCSVDYPDAPMCSFDTYYDAYCNGDGVTTTHNFFEIWVRVSSLCDNTNAGEWPLRCFILYFQGPQCITDGP